MTTAPSHYLGQAIREFRHRLGMSQEELAHRAGIDRSYGGAVERGQRDATVRILLRLAAGLETRLSEIVARAEELAQDPSG